jgi:hypothetical protein
MEPVIALTGLMMGAVCVYALLRLGPVDTLSPPVQMIWWFFLLMAFSTFVGAFFGHAFNYKFGLAGKAVCWILSLLSMAALAQAAIEHARPLLENGTVLFLTIANVGGLLGAMLVLLVYKNYHGMEVHAAYTLIMLMFPLEWMIYQELGDPGSLLLMLSVLPAMVSVLPILAKWSPSVWFTDFDVAHVVLLATLWLILLAGEQIQMGG